MNNVTIECTADFLSRSIPPEMIPRRFAVATNLILCMSDGGTPSLLLFNYEPDRWNQWYPYFSSVNGAKEFSAASYGELIDEVKEEVLTLPAAQNRLATAISGASEVLRVGSMDVEPFPAGPEFALKYSKTSEVWTVYYFEFMRVVSVSGVSQSSFPEGVVAFLPLDESSVSAVIEDGVFKGVQVVDNTIELLSNRSSLDVMRTQLTAVSE